MCITFMNILSTCEPPQNVMWCTCSMAKKIAHFSIYAYSQGHKSSYFIQAQKKQVSLCELIKKKNYFYGNHRAKVSQDIDPYCSNIMMHAIHRLYKYYTKYDLLGCTLVHIVMHYITTCTLIFGLNKLLHKFCAIKQNVYLKIKY